MIDRIPLVAQALALGLALTAPLHAQATQYTITNCGAGQTGDAVGYAGLSDTGFVTGWVVAFSGGFGSTGFRWSPRSTVVPSPPPGPAWLTFCAIDVNNAGTYVGWYSDLSQDSLIQGFRCKGGVTEELLTPVGLRAFPHKMNDAGWIVGQAGLKLANTPAAVKWSPDGVPSFVGHLSSALDINNHNQIVGYSMDANDVTSAFLVDEDELIPLGTLDPSGQGSVIPWAINDLGQVVGYFEIGGIKHAFLWSAETGMTELPGLGFQVFPLDVVALDINDDGLIVGYAPNATGQTTVLWRPDGSVTELAPLVPEVGIEKDWMNLLSAVRINAAGQISGIATHKPTNYKARTMLLTPAELQAGALLPGTAGSVSTLQASGATPGGLVALAVGADDPLGAGYTLLPACKPIGLAMEAPEVIALDVADGAGHVRFHWGVPASFAGLDLRLQVFELDACAVSNVVFVSP